ncbi:MAG: response regulator [Clostridia bacterium]|nr:response regulator [Clostridia bacterium]
MIKTCIDEAIAEYIQTLICQDEMSDDDTRRLMDRSREALRVDSIYISEMLTDTLGHVFTHMSVSDEKLDMTGQKVLLSRDEYNEMVSRFDENGFLIVEEEKLKDDYHGSNICFGMKRGQTYEAFVGVFSSDRDRKWTEEEKAAVKKLARALTRVVENSRFTSQNDQRVRDALIYNYLLWEYDVICFADIENETYTTFRQSKYTGIKLQAEENYSDAVRRFTPKIDPEYREFWEKLEDKQTLIDILSKEDRREFIYKMVDMGNPWRRMILQVVERKNGDASKILLSVMGIDNQRAEHIELAKKVEEQNRELEIAKDRAEEANAAKRKFLFNMSHDIRTPMNAILGFTEIARDNIEDTARVSDCLNKVKLSGEHLLHLINDVLDMSRIESGKTVIKESPMDITECGRDILSLVHRAASEKKIEISCNAENLVHTKVWADVLHIKRVILNIISNAIKYTATGGSVVFKMCEKDSDVPGYGRFEFSVTDNGIGMTSAFLEHIFEPFSRAATSTKSGIEGTGLGMAIAQNLVQLMGGKLDISSTPGEGTSVLLSIDLRIQKEETQAQENTDSNKYIQEELAGKKVLLVDDNGLNREIAQNLLEHFGMNVATADDGAVAVKMMENNPDYDIVLMDIQMPVMDGYEATREIRHMKTKASEIPIVAMTANAFAEDREQALEAGMNEHLGKPINVDLLKKILARYVS